MKGLKELTIENLKKFCDKESLEKENLYEILKEKDFYKSLNLNFAIIYNYDSVEFGSVNDLKIDIDNIIEARFFNENKEIYFSNDNDTIKGNLVDIKSGGFSDNEIIDDKFIVYGNKKYNYINYKKLIAYDEDNAAYIYYIKPSSFQLNLKGGKIYE